MLKVVGLARANNVSIMLTQFADFKGGAADIRATVLSGTPLSIERLSLLCQVLQHFLSMFAPRRRVLHAPFTVDMSMKEFTCMLGSDNPWLRLVHKPAMLGISMKDIVCILGSEIFHGCLAEFVKGSGKLGCMYA